MSQVPSTEIGKLRQIVSELQAELARYERAYRSLLDHVNTLQPNIRVLQLQKELEQEVEKRKALSRRVTELLYERK